jgi:integrase
VDIIRNLAEQERKMLLESTCGLDRIMLLLLFETGLEVEDLIKIRVSDVDIDGRSILLHGGESIKLSSQTFEELKRFLQARPDQVFLFEGRCGKHVTVKWKRCVLEKLLQMTELKDQGLKGQG